MQILSWNEFYHKGQVFKFLNKDGTHIICINFLLLNIFIMLSLVISSKIELGTYFSHKNQSWQSYFNQKRWTIPKCWPVVSPLTEKYWKLKIRKPWIGIQSVHFEEPVMLNAWTSTLFNNISSNFQIFEGNCFKI